MKIKSITLSVIAIVGIHIQSNAQCVANQNNVHSFVYDGNTYKVVKEAQDWNYARSCADNEGGFLAEINSQEEQDAIFAGVNAAGITASNTVAPDGGNASYLWIGGSDISVEGEWNWSPNNGNFTSFWQGTGATGSAVGGLYNNWGSSGSGTEPDNFGSGQDALGFAFTNWPLGLAGQWNDVDHTNSLYYIIEYVGDPLGLNDSKAEVELSIYPNPCANLLTINLPAATQLNTSSVAKIYNVLGSVVSEIKLTSTTQTINTNQLEDGVYFIKIEDELIGNVVKKFVVKK